MRSVTKSRNGCARCKRQKVRCDQTKPSCGRCLRAGVQCPGYTQQLKWSTKYEKLVDQGALGGSMAPETPRAESLFPGLSMEAFLSMEIPDFDPMSPFNPTNAGLEAIPSPVVEPCAEGVAPLDALIVDSVQNAQTEQQLISAAGASGVSRSYTPTPQICRSLIDTPTVLTEFYFKEAASLYSVYDSSMNPFRSTVSQLWKSSRLLHCTLQSMSAACLLDNFPHLAPIGNQLRNEAISILQEQQTHDHASLLALLMLGGSSSWHDTQQTGSKWFNVARRRLDHMVDTAQLHKDSNNYHFFEEALIYWELLLVYVADDVVRSSDDKDVTNQSVYFPARQIPHPWTGIARDTQIIVQEVGRLIRRSRILARSSHFTTQAQIKDLQQSLSTAKRLEAKLLTFVYPDEQDVVSPGDRVTPVSHLLTLAEVYRRAGLAQLYRVFPDLLDSRLRMEEDAATVYSQVTETLPEDHDTQSRDDRVRRNEWLTSYVLEAFRMLETISIESGTRDFQPFLLVALCSELRMPKPVSKSEAYFASPTTATISNLSIPDLDDEVDPPFDCYSDQPPDIFGPPTLSGNPELSLHSIDIIRTRQFVLDRLASFCRVLPPKPIRVCLDIVTASWARMDECLTLKTAQEDVYWMDVMMDNGWETCLA
ncbi:hypothetical protein BDV96DRAFT_90985 [Lophiotrema nucula]|uniref:Zn(2)-C6 fungal-type domain-containing protein n=1 Tax=Lophiotrema nucula TaxID=690887 RepID=A0A6A5Z6T5_9PLEO|nr:hypothetical protein BDV96DRAFT_90985 [Lophiotrema nucula]